MAIIGMMLLANGMTTEFSIPMWAVAWCASAITLGTMFGGWRIIRTLGFGLFRVKITHSVANQLGSALVNTLAHDIDLIHDKYNHAVELCAQSIAKLLNQDDYKRIIMHREVLTQLREVAKRIQVTANSLEDMAIKVI